jgi:hypothetical protein
MTQAGVGHPGTCGVCGSRLKRNGTTSSGRVRWRCIGCGGSSLKPRLDVTHVAVLNEFLNWLLGNNSQRELGGGSGRSFRDKHSWCWKVKPRVEITGEIYDEIQVDGTYLGDGWCLLTAINGAGEVVNWQWCNRESTEAYRSLLAPIPAPLVVVCDGGVGLPTALKELWPKTKIQRCLVHVQRNIRTYVTTNPRSEAGKAMRKLSLSLTRIKTDEEAVNWLKALEAWHQLYGELIKQKTYANSEGAQRPTWAKADSTWWWTHERLRKAWSLLSRLSKQKVLFTYLEPEFSGLDISSTTNRIEGGTNGCAKDLLRRHRGMPSAHQRRALDWLCYMHSPKPKPPSTFIKPEYFIDKPKKKITSESEEVPGDYGTGIETLDGGDGIWVRKGWGGRSK